MLSTFNQGAMMEALETPYDVDVREDFIECEVCTKTIRGDSLYKIHLTTQGHIKKEDLMIAQGLAVRDRAVPDFADLMEYLRYLNLDEPIVGLSQLEEVRRSDPLDIQQGPSYACRLCDLEANLPNMVSHIIGRKHRQRFLEVKRPDLVTWHLAGPVPSNATSGKVMRAKAVVAERQDGRGTPQPMKKSLAKSVGKSNISRVPPLMKKNLDQNSSRREPSQSQKFTDHPGEYSHHSGRPLDDPNMPPYRTNDRYMLENAEGGAYPDEGHLHRREFAEDDYYRKYGEDSEDMSRRNFPESGGNRRDSRKEMTYEATYKEALPNRNPSAGSDPLREFMEAERGRVPSAEAVESRKRAYPAHNPHGSTYAEDDPHSRAYRPEGSGQAAPGAGFQGGTSIDYSHGRVPFDIDDHLRQLRSPNPPYSNPRSDPSQRSYPEDEGQDRAYSGDDPYRPLYPDTNPQRQSQERGANRSGNANGAGRREPRGQDAKRQRLDEPMEMGQWQEGPSGDPSFSSRGPPMPNRGPEGARAMSDIPEPFRRFLQGASEDQMNAGKRRKKSRFSDATEEEMKRAKGMVMDEYKSPDQEMYGPSGQGPRTQDIHRPQRPDPYAQQGKYNTESYPRQNPGSLSEKPPGSGNVFDLMNNIEIADVEEADFLKSKLCNLLKEFQAKKLEKTSLKSQGPAGMSADYHHMSNDQRPPPPGQYDRNFTEGPQDQRAPVPGQRDRNFTDVLQNQRAPAPGQRDRNFTEVPQNQRASVPGQRDRNFTEVLQNQRAPVPGQRDRSFREGPQGQWAPQPGPHERSFPEERQDRRLESQRRQPQEARRQQRDRNERGQLQDDRSHGHHHPQDSHHPPGHPQNRVSNRSRYEEVFGGAGQGLPPRALLQEEPPLYPERFDEPRDPHRRPSGSRQYFDHYPPANAFHEAEQGYGNQRRPQHLSSLDKITSTLLELVARK